MTSVSDGAKQEACEELLKQGYINILRPQHNIVTHIVCIHIYTVNTVETKNAYNENLS